MCHTMRPTDSYEAGKPCTPVQQTRLTDWIAADGASVTAVSAAALLDAAGSSPDA